MRKRVCVICLAALFVFAAGCGNSSGRQEAAEEEEILREATEEEAESAAEEAAEEAAAEDRAQEETEAGESEVTEKGIDFDADLSPETAAEEEESETVEARGLIVIDPGHQAQGDNDTEPNGPGSSEMKAKVSTGTSGVSTGLTEYELNLEVSLKLRDELTARGYDVIMTRETNDVRISNAERAQIANEANADAFVRVHANGDDDHSVNGVVTICQTAANPYNADLYAESYLLSELILDAVVEATGANRQNIWETDTMTGINWCEVPSTIVEMGFMSNPEEDERMATEEYQYRIVEGIANGIDQFMEAEGR